MVNEGVDNKVPGGQESQENITSAEEFLTRQLERDLRKGIIKEKNLSPKQEMDALQMAIDSGKIKKGPSTERLARKLLKKLLKQPVGKIVESSPVSPPNEPIPFHQRTEGGNSRETPHSGK